MGVSNNFGFRYPDMSDSPNGPDQIKNLADDLDAYLQTRRLRTFEMVLTADLTIMSSADHAEIPAFAVPSILPGGSWWRVSTSLIYSAPIAADVMFAINGSAIESAYLTPFSPNAQLPAAGQRSSELDMEPRRVMRRLNDTGVPLGGAGVGSLVGSAPMGYIKMLNGAGSTIAFTWAQITSNVGTTTLHAGSMVELKRYA